MSIEKTTKVTDKDVKAGTVANVTEKKAEPAKKAAVAKTAEKKAEPAKKVAEAKTVAKKAEPAKKAAAKTTTKKDATKTAAKKTATKKEIETAVYLQFAGTEVSSQELIDRVIAACGEKPSAIKTINLYVQPETNKVYYTVNGDKGDIDLY